MWSQLDANMHLRHSAYADFAAQARIELLESAGLGYAEFQKLKVGPILFREELIYLKEVRASDTITIATVLWKTARERSRWFIRHELFRGDGEKAAVINVEGAWMDVEKRKLTSLPPELLDKFIALFKSEDYVEE